MSDPEAINAVEAVRAVRDLPDDLVGAVAAQVAAQMADAMAERAKHGARLMQQLRRDVARLTTALAGARQILTRVYHWHDRIDLDVMHLARALVETQGVHDLRVALCAAADCDYTLTAAGMPMPPRRVEPR